MSRVKWMGVCLFLGSLLVLGWMMQVRGDETTISVEFEDQLDDTYYTNTRKLNILLKDFQRKEDVICYVNGEEIMIDWEDETKGSVTLNENGWYKIKVTYEEEEVIFPEFCIDKKSPSKVDVDLGDYKENTWTKENVKLIVSDSLALSGIERYEYRKENEKWTILEHNVLELKKSFTGNIQIRSVSNAGLKSEVVQVKIKIWKEKPENVLVKLEKKNKNGWYQWMPKLTVYEKERREGPSVKTFYEVKSENEDTVYEEVIPEFYKDGKYTLSWWTIDELGHKSEKQKIEDIWIDGTKPKITVVGDIKGEEYRKENQKIKIQMDDMYLSKNGSFVETTGTVTNTDSIIYVDFETDGKHTCKIVATDQAGNFVTQEIPSFVLDKTIPKVSIKGIKSLHSYRKKVMPIVSWEDDNLNLEACSVKLNNKEIKSGITKEGQIKFPVEEDGHHSLEVKGFDKAGNEISSKVLFTVNQRGSKIKLLTQDLIGKKINKDQVQVQFQVDNIDPYIVESFQLNHKEVKFIQRKNIVTMTDKIKQDGRYTISFVVKDMSGNRSEYKAGNEFYYDGTPPELLILGVEDKKIYKGTQKIQIKTQSEEDIITQIKVNEKTITNTTNNKYLNLGKGTYKITVSGKDEVGNEAQKTISFQIKEDKDKNAFVGIQKQVEKQVEKIRAIPKNVTNEVKKRPIRIYLIGISAVICVLILFVKEKRKK